MKNVQVIAGKLLDLVSEIETYSFYKQNLSKSLERLFNDYQAGKYTYFEYDKLQKKMLKGRTKEEWINYYNSYILSLLKRIETYNAQMFYEAYTDTRYVKMEIVKPRPKPVPKHLPKHVEAPKPAPESVAPRHVEAPKVKPEVAKEVEVRAKPLPIEAAPAETMVEALEAEAAPEVKLVEVKPSLMDRISLFFKRIFARKEIKKQMGGIRAEPGTKPAEKPEVRPAEAPAEEEMVLKPSVEGPKYTWWDWFVGKPRPEKLFTEKGTKLGKAKISTPGKAKSSIGVAMGHLFGIDYIRNLLWRSRKVEFEDKSSETPMSTIHLETLRRKAKPEIRTQIEKITATSLTKEAKRIKSIMEKRKALKIYQPSFFGSLANLVIRRTSLYLLDNFPDFFKDLYHALRLANIKVLSNTYVNMMVLGVMLSTLMGFFLFGFFFSASALPLSQIIFRTIMMGFLTGLAAFAGFYSYPYSKMKQRRRSINTNLPFAINHMAAVSSSGVSPVRMFKLISVSKEYGEVSVEIEKIVNYIEIFGYDVLTALKSVAATTPSYQFKDFFEGMISTTQTGGDLRQYFSQKSEEAMMNYKMERQKYTETVSTYSDIYTGILIAAPLFFVAALSLVSLLGGKVGGMNVNIVIVLGTYVIIPLMNVSFLTFLTMTQPEI